MFIKPFSHKTILLTIHQNKDKNQKIYFILFFLILKKYLSMRGFNSSGFETRIHQTTIPGSTSGGTEEEAEFEPK